MDVFKRLDEIRKRQKRGRLVLRSFDDVKHAIDPVQSEAGCR